MLLTPIIGLSATLSIFQTLIFLNVPINFSAFVTFAACFLFSIIKTSKTSFLAKKFHKIILLFLIFFPSILFYSPIQNKIDHIYNTQNYDNFFHASNAKDILLKDTPDYNPSINDFYKHAIEKYRILNTRLGFNYILAFLSILTGIDPANIIAPFLYSLFVSYVMACLFAILELCSRATMPLKILAFLLLCFSAVQINMYYRFFAPNTIGLLFSLPAYIYILKERQYNIYSVLFLALITSGIITTYPEILPQIALILFFYIIFHHYKSIYNVKRIKNLFAFLLLTLVCSIIFNIDGFLLFSQGLQRRLLVLTGDLSHPVHSNYPSNFFFGLSQLFFGESQPNPFQRTILSFLIVFLIINIFRFSRNVRNALLSLFAVYTCSYYYFLSTSYTYGIYKTAIFIAPFAAICLAMAISNNAFRRISTRSIPYLLLCLFISLNISTIIQFKHNYHLSIDDSEMCYSFKGLSAVLESSSSQSKISAASIPSDVISMWANYWAQDENITIQHIAHPRELKAWGIQKKALLTEFILYPNHSTDIFNFDNDNVTPIWKNNVYSLYNDIELFYTLGNGWGAVHKSGKNLYRNISDIAEIKFIARRYLSACLTLELETPSACSIIILLDNIMLKKIQLNQGVQTIDVTHIPISPTNLDFLSTLAIKTVDESPNKVIPPIKIFSLSFSPENKNLIFDRYHAGQTDYIVFNKQEDDILNIKYFASPVARTALLDIFFDFPFYAFLGEGWHAKEGSPNEGIKRWITPNGTINIKCNKNVNFDFVIKCLWGVSGFFDIYINDRYFSSFTTTGNAQNIWVKDCSFQKGDFCITIKERDGKTINAKNDNRLLCLYIQEITFYEKFTLESKCDS